MPAAANAATSGGASVLNRHWRTTIPGSAAQLGHHHRADVARYRAAALDAEFGTARADRA
jgi:hypothetical protein